jgi:negative regulator of sigma E activity
VKAMNEEYLWEKNGTDSEIQRLEELLSPMRYVPAAPPSLHVAKRPAFGWLRAWITPATGALAAAGVVLAIGAGWQLSKPGRVNEQASVQAPVKVEREQPLPATSEPAAPAPPVSKPISATRALHVPKMHSPRPQLASTKYRKPRSLDTRITKEELRAYEQVMLALSIASDKLKLVSEAANGSDE